MMQENKRCLFFVEANDILSGRQRLPADIVMRRLKIHNGLEIEKDCLRQWTGMHIDGGRCTSGRTVFIVGIVVAATANAKLVMDQIQYLIVSTLC